MNASRIEVAEVLHARDLRLLQNAILNQSRAEAVFAFVSDHLADAYDLKDGAKVDPSTGVIIRTTTEVPVGEA